MQVMHLITFSNIIVCYYDDKDYISYKRLKCVMSSVPFLHPECAENHLKFVIRLYNTINQPELTACLVLLC